MDRMEELARKLGHAIQEDTRYIAMASARQESDADEQLQQLIGDFNLKRLAINNESSAEEPSDEKIREYNKQLRAIYAEIMSNDHMKAYEAAKNAFDLAFNRVTAIIQKSADGEDPDTADIDASGCTGSCATCGGCH